MCHLDLEARVILIDLKIQTQRATNYTTSSVKSQIYSVFFAIPKLSQYKTRKETKNIFKKNLKKQIFAGTKSNLKRIDRRTETKKGVFRHF